MGELAERSVENALMYGVSVSDSSYMPPYRLMESAVYNADKGLIGRGARGTQTQALSVAVCISTRIMALRS